MEEINNPPLADSDGEETSCKECGLQLGSAREITDHFRAYHTDKEVPKTPEDIRSGAKFTDKGRRSIFKQNPEKSL